MCVILSESKSEQALRVASSHRILARMAGWVILAIFMGCGRIGYLALDELPAGGELDPARQDAAKTADFTGGASDGSVWKGSDVVVAEDATPDTLLEDGGPEGQDATFEDGGPAQDASIDACSTCAPSSVIVTGQDQTVQRGDTTAGTPYLDVCPDNQVLLGFQGSVSRNPAIAWLHSTQALCGTISIVGTASYQVVTTAGMWLPERGMDGGVSWSSLCPANQVVVGADGRSSGYVDQLAIRCAQLSVTGAPGAYTISIGAITLLPPVGSNSGTPFPTTDCPSGEVARGTNLRADNYPRAFGLICGKPSPVLP